MGDKKIVLAIDDNVVQLKLFQSILEQKYDLRGVTSASQALNFLNTNKMDIILLDIDMPNIDGFEFLKDIRKIPSHLDVPIIIVSGLSGEEFLSKARNSTAADVLIKPVSSEGLIGAIEKALAAAG